MDSLKGDLMRLADDRPHAAPDATTVIMRQVSKRKPAKTKTADATPADRPPRPPQTTPPSPTPAARREPAASPFAPAPYREWAPACRRIIAVAAAIAVVALVIMIAAPILARPAAAALAAAIAACVAAVVAGVLHDRESALSAVAAAHRVAVVDMRWDGVLRGRALVQQGDGARLVEVLVRARAGRAWMIDAERR